MSQTTCLRCDAAVRGLVCEYCGALHHPPINPAEEKEAWVQFLNIMQTQPADTQIRMLQNGFLPDHVPNLIDAGLHCVGLLDTSQPAADLVSAASQRLQAITAKLKILPETPESERAIAEFSSAMDQHRHADRQLTRIVVSILLLGALFVVVFLIWLVGKF
jgi:hypothetical protein